MPMLSLADVDIQQKRLLIRVDFNVPMQDGRITNDARIRATLPTIQQALKAQARILLVSHLGRPKPGQFDPAFSLAPIAQRLSELLKQPVPLLNDWIDGVSIQPGQVAIAENVRFLPGEETDDPELAKKMAQLCDVFVMDAFGAAHRAHASTHGIAKFAPIACAGPLVLAEVAALEKALVAPKRPLAAVVGGSKVSSKLSVLEQLVNKVDCLIVGGGIANTFLAAQGYGVGKSLYEKDLIPVAKKLQEQLHARGAALPLPVDVVVAAEFSADATAHVCSVHEVPADKMILDIGPETIKLYQQQLMKAGTIIWNGPVGVFEMPAFSRGTEAIAHTIAISPAFSLAGGGDTLAAIEEYKVEKDISYISTGGGVFLEFLGGAELPSLKILESRNK
jgi:phosphoglycerate kinase